MMMNGWIRLNKLIYGNKKVFVCSTRSNKIISISCFATHDPPAVFYYVKSFFMALFTSSFLRV